MSTPPPFWVNPSSGGYGKHRWVLKPAHFRRVFPQHCPDLAGFSALCGVIIVIIGEALAFWGRRFFLSSQLHLCLSKLCKGGGKKRSLVRTESGGRGSEMTEVRPQPAAMSLACDTLHLRGSPFPHFWYIVKILQQSLFRTHRFALGMNQNCRVVGKVHRGEGEA